MDDRESPTSASQHPTSASPTSASNVSLRVGVYILLYILVARLFAPLIVWIGGYFLGVTVSQLVAAVSANWIVLRIYGRLHLGDLGLRFNRASMWNLVLGVSGGMGAAALVLVPPLTLRLARLVPVPDAHAAWYIFLFTTSALLVGSAGEEMLFRGSGFQMLL